MFASRLEMLCCAPTLLACGHTVLAQESPSFADPQSLAAVLVPQSLLDRQLAAVEALSRSTDKRIPEILLSHWANQGPRVHRAVVPMLLWREPWLAALDPVNSTRPELSASLDWARRDLALRHPIVDVRRRAEKLVSLPIAKPEIQAALDKFRPSLSRKGDKVRGKQLFTGATCANCHRLEDVGRHVGLDLSRLVDESRVTLLTDTLDPNRQVYHAYLEYTLVTKDGRQLSGMCFDESQACITLADPNGEPRIVERDAIDDMVCNHRSYMPEGLEAKLTVGQMADLLAFLVGTIPANANDSEPASR